MVTDPRSDAERNPASKIEGGALASTIQVMANVTVSLTLIVTIALFVLQQLDSERKRRTETAVEFVMLRHEDLYMQSAASISEAYQNDERTELIGGNQVSDEIKLKEEVALKAGLSNIERLADLHRDVIDCVEAEMCDPRMIEHSYRTQIWSLYCLVPNSVRERLETQLNEPDYWVPLERYIAGGAHWSHPKKDARSARKARAAAEQSCEVDKLPKLDS